MNGEMVTGLILMIAGGLGLFTLVFARLEDLHKRLFNLEYPKLSDLPDDAERFFKDDK